MLVDLYKMSFTRVAYIQKEFFHFIRYSIKLCSMLCRLLLVDGGNIA